MEAEDRDDTTASRTPTGDANLGPPTLTAGAESEAPGPAAALLARLDACEPRYLEHAAREKPQGLTDPDPGSEERWEAGHVWAHVGEFPTYWMGQIQVVVEGSRESGGEPVPFGRTKADAARIAAIEEFSDLPPEDAVERLSAGLAFVRQGLMSLPEAAWELRGVHPTLGPMTVAAISDRFIAAHLEEHADQLDRLREQD